MLIEILSTGAQNYTKHPTCKGLQSINDLQIQYIQGHRNGSYNSNRRWQTCHFMLVACFQQLFQHLCLPLFPKFWHHVI